MNEESWLAICQLWWMVSTKVKINYALFSSTSDRFCLGFFSQLSNVRKRHSCFPVVSFPHLKKVNFYTAINFKNCEIMFQSH